MDEVVAGYRLEAPVGQGGGGTVWRARRPGPPGQPVALKRVSRPALPAAVEALRREAAVLAALDHPHVIAVHDVVDDPPGIALVMPLALGGSLRDLLDERGTLTPGEVVAVLAPLADALASAHRRGIVHGDVKPANILFTADGEPLLADFGVARLVGGADGPVASTAAYLDPCGRHDPAADPRFDVYGLGIVAYEALTGRLPFGTDSTAAVEAAAGRHRPLTDLRSVPAPLAELVEQAIDGDPRARPASAAALATALRGAVERTEAQLPRVGTLVERIGPTTPATAPFGPVPPPTPAVVVGHRTRRALTLLVALVALAGVAVGGAVAVLRAGPFRAAPAARQRAARAVPTTATAPVVPGAGSPTATRPPAAVPVRRRPRACPVVVPPGGPADGPPLVADLDGDGCQDAARWNGRVLLVQVAGRPGPPRRYRLGRPGDQLLLGDWTCGGAATPALYRPADGTVLSVDRFAAEVGQRIEATRVERRRPAGRAKVVHLPRGCDIVVVGPAPPAR